jgi:flagella basal body P-ring formation protein FlgA
MRSLSLIICVGGALAGATLVPDVSAVAATSWAASSAPAVIERAILERVGARAEVVVRTVDPAPDGLFREARPDPAAVLGKPIRFTLIPERGASVPVVATVDVVADHATTRHGIARGHTIVAADLEPVRGPLRGLPLRATPTAAMLAGARALRPIAAGAVVLPSFVAMRRAVEAGDRVTVVAVSGDVEVSATFVAADGGAIGATIRVLNPDTRRLIRGRVVGDGLVEVMYGR